MPDTDDTSPDPKTDDTSPDPKEDKAGRKQVLDDLDVTKEAGASVKGGVPKLPPGG